MWLVVDVEPLPAAFAAELGGASDELCAEATPLHVGMHGRVKQERVPAAVGRDIDVADEPLALISTEMDEADLPLGQRSLPWAAPGGFPEGAERLQRRERIDANVDAQSFLLNMTFESPSE